MAADLKQIEAIGSQLEEILRTVPGTRSVFAERAAGGYFVDLDLDRQALARFGLSVGAVQDVIMSAVGGENVTTTVEGRARYPVNVRYPRGLRDDVTRLGQVLVMTPSGAQVPLAQLARVRTVAGPAMIRNENGMMAGYVFVDMTDSDVGGYVERARAAVASRLSLPSGYSIEWSGQYQNMLRVRERLKIVVPITLFLIFFLLYMNTKSAFKASVVMLAVPFSVVGAVWLMYILGYNVSIAAWVGMIALMGLDAETGVFMLLFLDLSYDEAKRQNRLRIAGRAEGRDHPWRGETRSAEDDDRDGRHGGLDADHVVSRVGRRRHEASRRPDGRGTRHVVHHGTTRLPGDLPAVEEEGTQAAVGCRREPQ